MGDQATDKPPDQQHLRAFTKALLEDVAALERMLDEGLIETGVRRIGAEQEMFLVDRAMRPALKADALLARMKHPQLTPELGLFNLELNLEPQELTGDCLWRMEKEVEDLLAQVRVAADAEDTRVLLTGILPTLKQGDLSLKSMTPRPRYEFLNRTTVERRGGSFRIVLKGLDELSVTHDNVMCEACNTSFQIHFQVGPEEFANLYNLAQAITGPVVAAAANSPVFLQHRLWHETRLALFTQSIDSRPAAHEARQAPSRVIFGMDWVRGSVLDLFHEDITRYRVFMPSPPGESPMDMLDRGEIPPLGALCTHNGTVYRWNRPCYGVKDNKAHLRIEHRALPAGPTVVDEVANAAFFHGLMTHFSQKYDDITQVMAFDDAKSNFTAAARYGLKARLMWFDGKEYSAQHLLLNKLIPAAREGLASKGVREEDIERYLGTLERRVRKGRTGSQWALDSLEAMGSKGRRDGRYIALTASMYANQMEGRPVHEWKLATLDANTDWRDSCRTVEQVMSTDLFTLHPDDLVDLAASMMDWEHIRHVPVEDGEGRLVGLVSHRQLLRLMGRGLRGGGDAVPVSQIMAKNPLAVTPETSTLEAIGIMRDHRVSALPVVDEARRLVGIVSERDFIDVTAKLLEDGLRET